MTAEIVIYAATSLSAFRVSEHISKTYAKSDIISLGLSSLPDLTCFKLVLDVS